jgi:predicted PurR-regulated permease PerM
MFLVLHLMGVRYALLLSTLVGVVEIIPVVGPLLSTLTVLAVPAFAGYPHLGWLVAIVLATRLLLDNFVQPLLMSQGVALHPMVIILGAMAGEKIAGMLGIFLSIPVLAVLRIVVVRYRRRMASPTVTVASS